MQATAVLLPALIVVALMPAAASAAGPFESKAIAKAKLHRVGADVGELMVARRGAARQCCDARIVEFLEGRGTLRFLQDSIRDLVRAELALCKTDGERLAAWEETWRISWLNEDINHGRSDRGRIPYKEYMETKSDRLDAAMVLIPAWKKTGRAGTPVPFRTPSCAYFAPADPSGELLLAKDLARASFDAHGAVAKELAQAKLEAQRIVFHSRESEFLAGRGTLPFVIETCQYLLQAALTVSDTEAEGFSDVEGFWITAQENENINHDRYQTGRITLADCVFAQRSRLDATMSLIRAKSKLSPGNAYVPRPALWDYWDRFLDKHDWFASQEKHFHKRMASAMAKALRGDPQELSRARRDASRVVFDARRNEFLTGRGTLDFLIDSALRLLEDELALTDQPEKRAAAMEQCWERLMQIEVVNKQRYETGRIPLQDFEESRFHRLDVEIRLAREGQKNNRRSGLPPGSCSSIHYSTFASEGLPDPAGLGFPPRVYRKGKVGDRVNLQACVRMFVAVAIMGMFGGRLAADQPGPPKPGPEMDALKPMVGTWDCTVKMAGMPDSKGAAVYKMACNGMWVVSDFKSEFGGMPFEGKGIDGYDQMKKKYVSIWVDSMSATPMISEGTYDADKKTMTFVGDMLGMDGKMAKTKSVSETKDDNTVVFSMYQGGSDTPMMTITYNRRK
jgi:hypothetical protein